MCLQPRNWTLSSNQPPLTGPSYQISWKTLNHFSLDSRSTHKLIVFSEILIRILISVQLAWLTRIYLRANLSYSKNQTFKNNNNHFQLLLKFLFNKLTLIFLEIKLWIYNTDINKFSNLNLYSVKLLFSN